ncbi:MAG: hypothetical protein KC503_26205 [Myxococcales bacterium]|nr:hypothetical protein [Myxococcales bacterium]
MLLLTTSLCFVFAVGCGDSTPGSGDAGGDLTAREAGAEASTDGPPVGDGPGGADMQRDAPPAGDGTPGDGTPSDGTSSEASAGDGPTGDGGSTDSSVDSGSADTNAAKDFKAKINDVYAWANLQPVVAPDPTHTTVTLELKNNGSAAVSNIAIQSAVLTSTNTPSKTHTLSGLAPIGGFNGTLAAGSTVTVQYKNTPSSQQTPVAFTCNEKVDLALVVSSSDGYVSLSANTTFNCVY